MFYDAFASLSASSPHDGHEYSRTHNGLSVSASKRSRSASSTESHHGGESAANCQ